MKAKNTKVMLVLGVALFITLCRVHASFAVDVDLDKGLFRGKPLSTKVDYIVSLYGQPKKNDLLPSYYSYFATDGFQVGIDTYYNGAEWVGSKKVTGYSFYFVDWEPSNPTKVPKMNKAFKGTFSYGIRAGATFQEVLSNIRKSGKRFMAFKGNWCFNYSGRCKDPGYLIIFEINNQWYGEIKFDENGKAFALGLSGIKSTPGIYEVEQDGKNYTLILEGVAESSSPYFHRVNTQSIKEMQIIDYK